MAKNSDVKLIVSIGSSGGDIVAPDVTGKQFDEAISEILELELNYTVVEEESDDVPSGYVIRQTPLGGTKLNKDDIINIHVSKGKGESSAQATPAAERVSVPSIIGLGREQAEATLKANGLNLGNVSRKAPRHKRELLFPQSPELGKTANKGSYVSIVLSKGEEAQADQSKSTSGTKIIHHRQKNEQKQCKHKPKTVQAIQTHQATTIQVQTHLTVQTVIRVHQTKHQQELSL